MVQSSNRVSCLLIEEITVLATKGGSKYTDCVAYFQFRGVIFLLDAEQEIVVLPIWYEEVVLHAKELQRM